MRSLLVAAMLVPAIALGESPSTGPVLVGPEPVVVKGGPGNQTDPHVSATIVSYTNTDSATSEIRYQDLSSPGSDLAVPNLGHRDSLSDVSGDIIVFRRVYTDGSSSSRPILFFDRTQPALGTRELAPSPGARREAASVGGDTVAFVQQSGPSSSQSDICVASLANYLDPAQCLTSDGLSNRTPAVSPDGSTVVWAKCLTTGLGCDIYVSRRDGAGAWGAPLQLTSAPGEDVQPDTNGTIVTYASNAGGDWDIWFENVDGSDERQLVLSDAAGSNELNPNISGNLIAFERELPGSTNADIYVYELGSRTLFHLQDTPELDETLNDISQSGNTTWVVWASPDGLALGNNDVWAASFVIQAPPTCETPGDGGGDDDDDDGQHDDDDDGDHDDDDDGHWGKTSGDRKTWGHSNGLVSVCADPGSRPLLASLSVVRNRKAFARAETRFAATQGETGVMCVYNNDATAGWVALNHRVQLGFAAFKHKADVLAREVELRADNKLEAILAGKPGTSFEVRVYGESETCQTARLNEPDFSQRVALAQTQFATSATPVRVLNGVQLTALSNGMRVVEPEQVAPNVEALGCSTSGESSAGVAAFLLVTLWVLSRRVPAAVRVRRRR